MGVVYKLTEEVISFIIETKKTKKSISCRSLAQLAGEMFQVKVSKSSVNNVLKQALLSDSIGRKPGKSPSSKKFKIPSQKKQDLAESLKKSLKTLESKKTSNFLQKNISTPRAKKASILDSIKNSVTPKEEDALPSALISEDLNLSEKKKDDSENGPSGGPIVSKDLFLEKFNNFKQQREALRGGLISGVGYVFLKAAQWELFGSQGVSGVFDGKMFSFVADIQENLERMFIFEILGNKFLENAGNLKNHFLCKVSDTIQDSFQMEDLDSWTKSKVFSLEGKLSCAAKLEVSLVRVAGYCLDLEDGTKLFLDVLCQKVELAPIEEKQELFLNLALIQVSKNIIGGGELFLSSSSKEALHEYGQMCRNVKGKRLKKVSVFDRFSQEITSFSIMLNRERNFYTIDWISYENREIWTDRIKWAIRKPFYHFLSGKGYCYCVTDSKSLGEEYFIAEKERLKSIIVWKQGDLYPFVCLNYIENEDEVEEWLKKFLEKNIFSEKDLLQKKEYEDMTVRKEMFSEKSGLWDMLHLYVEILKEFCAKRYFNMNSFLEVERCFKSTLYRGAGYLLEVDEGIAVDLLTSVSGESFVNLCVACENINKREIRGVGGGKLHINLMQS